MKVTVSPLVAVLAASTVWGGHADAQVRVRGGVAVVRPRSGVAVGVTVGRPYYYRPLYRPFYRPYFFDPLYRPYYYGVYRPFYWYPYAQAGYYGYGRVDGDGSLRVQVMPRDTEVYIDNYYAGTVDDFDGFLQRLHVEPGAHDVTLYREGYRTVRQRIYIQPTGTFRLRYDMMPLAPGEPQEPRPLYPPPGPQGPPPVQAARPLSPGSQGEATLSIRVQPANAQVLIDGERWEASGDERLVVQVAPGAHRIEVRREGYRTYLSEVTIRPGETSAVNISLTRER